MHIEHMALWTHQLESLRHFYEHYFGAQAGARYDNPAKGFSSYFLSFDSGARLELMSRADIPVERVDPVLQRTGFIHLCFALGSVEAVDAFYARALADGLPLLEAPRWTGDGYYELTLQDPDGNRLEVSL